MIGVRATASRYGHACGTVVGTSDVATLIAAMRMVATAKVVGTAAMWVMSAAAPEVSGAAAVHGISTAPAMVGTVAAAA